MCLAIPARPESHLVLDDGRLSAIGFSCQITAYGRHLTLAILDGRLGQGALEATDDSVMSTFSGCNSHWICRPSMTAKINVES